MMASKASIESSKFQEDILYLPLKLGFLASQTSELGEQSLTLRCRLKDGMTV